MAQRTIRVSAEQVGAARTLVRICEDHGDPVDPLIRKIAEAEAEAAPLEGLSTGELAELHDLLGRYAEHDLAESIRWRIDTSHGPVYVRVRREGSEHMADADAYATVWPRD